MFAPMLLLALASSPAADSVAELSRGSALHRACQAEVRIMDLPTIAKATESDLLNGSYCVGYLNGFVANLQLATGICPGGAAIGDLVRTYVSFMQQNPDLLEKDRRLGINRALHDAYPCPVDAGPGASSHPSLRTTL